MIIWIPVKILTERRATSMTTSSTPGNSPINFLFAEISHQGKILNYVPNTFTNKNPLHCTSYNHMCQFEFCFFHSLEITLFAITFLVSSNLCLILWMHTYSILFLRGEWLKYIHIINQKRIEKIILCLIILQRYISQNQGINLSWIIITKHIVGNHQTNSSKFLLF